MTCPECNKAVLRLAQNTNNNVGAGHLSIVYPPNVAARPVPPEVPDPYRQDFIEANQVLRLSAKASAAISRRSLQSILREEAKTKSRDLYDQIEEVISAGNCPGYIADELHAVRNIGNFAAHPMKSSATGAIMDIEPGEAEWDLDVLESLHDFYFVQPALAAKRKAALNAKLQAAGKPTV